MSRLAADGRWWPLLRRYRVDAAVLVGTAAFLAVAGLLGLWLIHSH